MSEVRYYHNPAEKIRLRQSAHDRGLSVIHDDFKDEGNHNTKGDIGRLTFDNHSQTVERIIKEHDELLLLLYKKRIEYVDLLDLLTTQALKDNMTRWQRFKDLFGR